MSEAQRIGPGNCLTKTHAYAGAMARITGQPVCRRVLYFLHCGQVSDVPGADA